MKSSASLFQTFGTIQAGNFYVERRADDELFAELSKGKFCHVLGPRQIGKSSLRVRVAERLKFIGVRSATVDLSGIGGSSEGINSWYFSVIDQIASELELKDPEEFWNRQPDKLTLPQRFVHFLRDEVLSQTKERIVIFLDEIDSALSLPFAADADFFGVIRSIHNQRATKDDFGRLTFCLLGVLTPADLISDKSRTPYNCSTGIVLEDFTPDQAQVFLDGLRDCYPDPNQLLDEVLRWTQGHPSMTQELCEKLVEGAEGKRSDVLPEKLPEKLIERLVQDLFFRLGLEHPNLDEINRRFDNERLRDRVPRMLALYGELLDKKSIPAKATDTIQQELRIAGLVAERREEGGVFLRVRNPIMQRTFNVEWTHSREIPSFAAAFSDWRVSGGDHRKLLSGEDLAEMENWVRKRRPLTINEKEFLEASLRRRIKKRRLSSACIAAVALVTVLGVAGHLYQEREKQLHRDKDQRQRDEAQRQRDLDHEKLVVHHSEELDRYREQVKSLTELKQRMEKGYGRLIGELRVPKTARVQAIQGFFSLQDRMYPLLSNMQELNTQLGQLRDLLKHPDGPDSRLEAIRGKLQQIEKELTNAREETKNLQGTVFRELDLVSAGSPVRERRGKQRKGTSDIDEFVDPTLRAALSQYADGHYAEAIHLAEECRDKRGKIPPLAWLIIGCSASYQENERLVSRAQTHADTYGKRTIQYCRKRASQSREGETPTSQ